jgi:inosose dehydratase
MVTIDDWTPDYNGLRQSIISAPRGARPMTRKVRARGVEEKWDYRAFSDNGIFVELGEGLVDFPTLFQVLRAAEFRGWIVVETDVTRKPSALVSATISREYLKSIGV